MIHKKISKIWYGGDYNPDQWPSDLWIEDVRLFKLAGIDVGTFPVFSWAKLQPEEGRYDFSWLDAVLDLFSVHGLYACLATSTAAVPPWMAARYPDVLETMGDGMKRQYGGRHNFCPNSPSYRKFSSLLAGKMAERYAGHPALAAWHVNNEYYSRCYCENCEKAFRVYLQRKYATLDRLNEVWNTSFWGHTFSDWNHITLPSVRTEHWSENQTMFQGITLDYYRFVSDSLLECFILERDAIRAHDSGGVITTNLMGAFKGLDYFKWAKEMDIVSWDSYPAMDTPASETALRHDLMRGLKDGAPFMLMEQTPSQQNWQPYNSLKRPGVMRLQSWQAVARGSDTVMFFQLRRSRGACEKFHGAVIEHAGHGHTRVFKEIAALGDELKRCGSEIIQSRVVSEIGILFDWENWWAIEMSSGPSIALKYMDQMRRWHGALWSQNYPVDFVGLDADFSKYKVLIAPVLYMVKTGLDTKLERFVAAGGIFLTTFFSGIVDENDLVVLGGYPGKLRKLLGVWAEEIDALLPDARNAMEMESGTGLFSGTYECSLLCDLLHTEGAETLAVYGRDFYRGMPCLTRNDFGRGSAWYVATCPESAFLERLAAHLAGLKGIVPVLRAVPGLEVVRRVRGSDSYIFVLNHSDSPLRFSAGRSPCYDLLSGVALPDAVDVEAHGVLVLKEQ